MAPLHLLLGVLITFLWGFNFVVAKVGVENMPPVFFAGYRFLVVAAVLVPWLKYLPGQMARLVAIGLTSGALHFGLMLLAFSLSDNVGAIAVVVQLNVPFMVLLAVIFLGEKVGAWRIGGMGLAFAGVMLIGFDPVAFEELLPLVLVIVAGFSYAVSVVLMRGVRDAHPFQVQAWIAVLSFPFLMAGSFLFESGQVEAVVDFGWFGVAVVLYAAIGASVIGHGGMFFLLQRYPVTYLVPFMLAPPALGVFFGVTVLGNPLTWKIVAGGLMTLSGVGIIQAREAIRARGQAQQSGSPQQAGS